MPRAGAGPAAWGVFPRQRAPWRCQFRLAAKCRRMTGQAALTGTVFVREEVTLDAGLAAVRARLADLAWDGLLARASSDAYRQGLSGLMRSGAAAAVPGVAGVRVRDLAPADGWPAVALRWEATGPGGGLFAALDADLRVTPAGEQATVLMLAGAYRPPPGWVGADRHRAAMHQVAAATVRVFLGRVADAITRPLAQLD